MGTAGHVDHGKTSLIKALTGIDTDRLKEEKERGITIELGFAFLDCPDEKRLGIIDVPGHEKFVRNMVAGASGIDFVLLVIAADEGVMPQSREHISICSFLGITKGIVALTKIDMVGEDWLEMVKEDVQQYIASTPLVGAPIVPVSAQTGVGLTALKETIQKIASQIERREDAGVFRLPIDRVFTIKGFGTVVTGTIISGGVSVADEVVILPQKINSRVRMLQVHGNSVQEARHGQRTAVNLLNVEKTQITRGSLVTAANALYPSLRLDVSFTSDANFSGKIKNKDIVRFHSATSEITARITLLGANEIHAGESCFAQLYLQEKFAAIAGDRFVIRSFSPAVTIGGGVIIDPLARKCKRNCADAWEGMRHLAQGSLKERCALLVRRAGVVGIKPQELVVRLGSKSATVVQALRELTQAGELVLLDAESLECVATETLQRLQETIVARLATYHRQNPLTKGVNKEELRMLTGAYIPSRVFGEAWKRLEGMGKVKMEGNEMRLSSHAVDLPDELGMLKASIIEIYQKALLTPPNLKEVISSFPKKEKEFKAVLLLLLKEGVLVKIDEEMFFAAAAIAELREKYRNFLLAKGKATPADFRELTGLSRKYTIPLMEYFDIDKLTIRVGDARVLREKPA